MNINVSFRRGTAKFCNFTLASQVLHTDGLPLNCYHKLTEEATIKDLHKSKTEKQTRNPIYIAKTKQMNQRTYYITYIKRQSRHLSSNIIQTIYTSPKRKIQIISKRFILHFPHKYLMLLYPDMAQHRRRGET